MWANQKPFPDGTEIFQEHVMEIHRQLAMISPNVIIGDSHAAPTADHCDGQPTTEDKVVNVVMQHIGLHNLITSLRGPPSHRPMDSGIDLCHAGPEQVDVVLAWYHNLRSNRTSHRPLEIQI